MSASPVDPRGVGSKDDADADDLRRMAPIYVAVIVVEGIVLVGLYVFQTVFGAR